MQRLLGLVRKAITEYDMIQNGDHIAIGVSGGKDSVALTIALARLKEFIGIDFSITAITLDPCFGAKHCDYSAVEALFAEYKIPYIIKRTEIGEIVFDQRQETNPCSLCARMRRGALHDAAKAAGCNKIALGHHMDDAVETFIMNLFNEGRVGCFSPVTYLSRKDITMIRPLVLCEERDIKHAVKQMQFPVVRNECPVDGHTEREWTKQWFIEMEKQRRGIKKQVFGAMRRGHISNW